MKKFTLIFMMLASLFGLSQLRAEVKSPYKVDFNQSIDVSNPAFQVASNWQHIVDQATFTDYSGPTVVNMKYEYDTRDAFDGGCLFASDQKAINPSYWSTDPDQELCDLLVTPLITGDVKLMANPTTTDSSIEVYNINTDGTKGDLIKTWNPEKTWEWQEVTLLTSAETNGDYKRYGLRFKKIYIDNFEATSADIVKEKKLAITTVSPALNSYIYWDQNADGEVMVKYLVTVTNTGEDDLVKGEDGFSITLWEGKNNNNLVTVAVPQNLSVGETSDEFAVETLVDSELWGNTYSSVKINLRENITGTTKLATGSYYRAYEPRFVLRKVGSDDTEDYSTPIKYGLVNSEQSTALEIYNDGSAPLTIVSMSLPEGFTGLPDKTFPFVVGAKEKVPFSVTLPVTQTGSFSGQLKIVYIDSYDSETTYSLAISGTVVSPDSWICDFGYDTGVAPKGSIISEELSLYYSGDDAIGYCLQATSKGGEFITPKLDIKAGDILSFDTAQGYSYYYYETFGMNVYISTDRHNWGEPIKTLTENEITSTSFTTITVPFDVTGEYYVKFEYQKGKLDNLCGPKAIYDQYDIYLSDFTASEEVKSGEEISVKVSGFAVADLDASDYTMEYRTDDVVLHTFASEELKANALNEISFNAKFAPSVEETTVYDAYIQVKFKDGSVVKTPSKQLKVTYEPVFVFFDKDTPIYGTYQPSNREEPISFGATKESGATQEFEIYNWGSAPLKVSSIRVPVGFQVTPTSATVAAGERQPVVVKFIGTDYRAYKGNLEITYINKENKFTLPISATLLDPNKWYAEFTPEGNSYNPAWPAGTVHGANVTGNYKGNINNPMWFITSDDTSDNMFISPKVKASENEYLAINAMLGGYSDTGIINVYVADSRKALENDATRTKVATLDGTADDDNLKLTTAWKICEVEMPAGEYYVGFEIKDEACINYFYGLTEEAVENDINILSFTAPATVMQNTASEVVAKLHNYAPQIVNREDYKVAAYIDGVKVAETDGIDLPCATSYADAPVMVSVPVRFPKVGTSTVRLEVVIGDTTLSSDEAQVEVTPEVVSSEKQIGEVDKRSDDISPIEFYYYNTETVMLYTHDQLGLENGETITGIKFKGFLLNSDVKSDLKFAYALVDDSSISPAPGDFDFSNMTIAIDQEDFKWNKDGTAIDPVDYLNVTFSTPIVYEEGKSLLLFISSKDGSYVPYGSYGCQTSNIPDKCFHRGWDSSYNYPENWSSQNLPVLYLSLAAEPVKVSGVVYDEGEAVEGAVVTFVSADGENVQYTATTDATGAYTANIIQHNRTYNVTASANGKEDFVANKSFDSNADDLDFELLNVVEIDNLSGNTHNADAGALVKLNLQLEEGMNTIVLPFDVTAQEMTELFGENATVAEYSHSTLAEGSDELMLYFTSATSMEAGKPYIVSLAKRPEPVIYRGKEVVDGVNHSVDKNGNANFHATYEARVLSADEVLLSNDNYVGRRIRQVVTASPYSAYVKITNPAVKSVSFTVDGNITTGIEDALIDSFGENDVIFNIQGVGVKNPEKGIYIVNGKKIVVK